MVIKNLKNIYLPISLLSSKIHNHSRTCIIVSKPCSCMVDGISYGMGLGLGSGGGEERAMEMVRAALQSGPALPRARFHLPILAALPRARFHLLPFLGQPPLLGPAIARAATHCQAGPCLGNIASCGGSVRTIQLIFTFLSVFHHSSNGEIQISTCKVHI